MHNKIILVDDEKLFREGLKRILVEFGDFMIIQEASNGKELLKNFDENNLPDLILLDLSMPIMDGIETLKSLIQIHPNLKIAILSSHFDGALIVKMIELGAASFFAKNEDPNQLIVAINNIINKGFHYTDYIIQLLRSKMINAKVTGLHAEEITTREIEVLQKICAQKTSKEIADELFISPRTVEGHRNKLLEKTNSKNIAGLIIYAVENNLFKINQSPFNI